MGRLSRQGRPGEKAEPPKRDLQLDTLAGVLKGEILVQNHCYRADEMVQMIDIAKEFGYRITAFHHTVEAYKIGDILAANDICAAPGPTGGAASSSSTTRSRPMYRWSRPPGPARSSSRMTPT